jgi:hypothetical protein
MIVVKVMAVLLAAGLAVRWLWQRRWFRVCWWIGLALLIADFLWETNVALHLTGR